MGTTPLQWLQRVRIRHAQHLLEPPSIPLNASATRSVSAHPPPSAPASNTPSTSARKPIGECSAEPG
nr:hypothetical protein [Nocardia cyriacigeorgica]